MSNIEEKDLITQDDLDEPWLLNYNMPEGWFDFPISSPSWNFNMTDVFPFVHNPPPKGILQGITGLYNYKVPTDLQFAQCSKVNGLSLWDRNGWWQCLFPQEIIKNRLNKIYHDIEKVDLNKFVSKESVSNDPVTLSKYFNDYTKYLLWKSEQNKSSLSSSSSSLLLGANKKGEDRQSWLPVDKVTTPEDIMQTDWIDGDSNEENRKKVIGRSQYMTYSSNNSTFGNSDASDNSTKEVTTIKTFYDDGSCVIKEREKIIPNDGGEPIIKEREKVVKEKPSSSSSSWF